MPDANAVRTRVRPQRAVDLSSPETDAPKPQDHEGYALVTKTIYGVETEVMNEKIRVPLFTSHPARVRISGGLTKSLGDFNSARFDATLELPCYPVKEEWERAYNICSDAVDDWLRREVELATGQKA